MMISFMRKQSGQEFNKELEKEYSTIENLEKIVEKTNNSKLYVDLENWKYYSEHPDKEIEEAVSIVSNECFIDETDYAIILAIK